MAGVVGRSGRRAKPVAKKQLAGNPGKRALNTDEPDFGLVQTVDCPLWMGDFGRELWETIAPLLCSERVIEATDVQNLEVYCNAYDQFRMAQEEVRENGVTVMGANSLVKNPAVTAVKEASAMMATYGGMLGLDPSSRQRLVGGGKKKDACNPFAALLNG